MISAASAHLTFHRIHSDVYSILCNQKNLQELGQMSEKALIEMAETIIHANRKQAAPSGSLHPFVTSGTLLLPRLSFHACLSSPHCFNASLQQYLLSTAHSLSCLLALSS
jgi:hypothetical protein